MQLRWTSHLKKQEEKEEFLKHIKSNRSILERLSELLEQDLNQLEKDREDENNFTLPDWKTHQAFKLGERNRLRKILSLIKIGD